MCSESQAPRSHPTTRWFTAQLLEGYVPSFIEWIPYPVIVRSCPALLRAQAWVLNCVPIRALAIRPRVSNPIGLNVGVNNMRVNDLEAGQIGYAARKAHDVLLTKKMCVQGWAEKQLTLSSPHTLIYCPVICR